MKVLHFVLIAFSLVFTAISVKAQEKWTLESVFLRNKMAFFRLSNDYITIRPNDIRAFSPYIYQKAPSYQGLLTSNTYVRYLELNTLNQQEYFVGARWMRRDPAKNNFLGGSHFETWVSVRPKFYHSINIQMPTHPLDEVGDTISNFYYRAFLFRKQVGMGMSYSVQLYGHHRWRIYSGVQIGYQLEYGGRLQEYVGDAHIITHPDDSNKVFYQPINPRNQDLNISLAATHIFIAGFQLGLDFSIHKRIQLFGLVQTQLMAARNADANSNFSNGFAVPVSLGIRYLFKPQEARF